MASHAGIPTHMILNPEPNLRPLSIASRSRGEEGHPTTVPTLHNLHAEPCPPPTPIPHLPVPDTPLVTTRTSTTAVPVRSKQRSNNPEDPRPKKKATLGKPSGPFVFNPFHLPADY